MTPLLEGRSQRRKLAEAQMYAEKERAQVTLASIADSVITTNVDGPADTPVELGKPVGMPGIEPPNGVNIFNES